MKPEELRSKIRMAATRFTDDVIGAFAEAFSSVAADFSAAERPRAVRPAPAAKRAIKKGVAAKPAKPGKRIRRSADQLQDIGQMVVRLLQGNKKGLRVEHINKTLGTSTRQLMRPIQKLLAEGRLRKSGERRATTYYAG
jgi:hypothetical protein